MRKVYILALSLILTFTALPANAAVKAGATCKTSGQTSVVGSKIYTCVKSGTKLLWNSGILNNSPSPTAKPTQKESSVVVPTSFSDLFAHRDGIAYGAWSKFSTVLKNSSRALPSVEVFQGPNTKVYIKDQKIPMQFVTRLFPTFDLPKKVVFIYWDNQDMNWATTKATQIMGADEMQKVLRETGGPFVDCYTPTNCNVGHAHIAADGTAYIGLGNPDHAEGDPNFQKGQKEEIEFYHSLQLFQYYKHETSVTSKGTITSPNFPPAWINIAGENLTFDAFRFESDYQNFRMSQNFSEWMNQLGHPITARWLDDFLDIKNLNNSWSDDGNISVADNNCIGASIMEIFVALKGPSVMLDFHDQMSQGKSFLEAFKTEFGVSWDEASPIISKIIYDKYKNNY